MESISSRLGRTTIEITDLCKSYGDKVLIKDYTYFFLKDDRIGYIGPNGSGKSTLMKMIAGWVKPDSGTIEIGQTVNSAISPRKTRTWTRVSRSSTTSRMSQSM